MTQKDFIVLAKILRDAFENADPYHEGAIVAVAENIADHCAGQNDRFDSKRFFDAAGMTEWRQDELHDV